MKVQLYQDLLTVNWNLLFSFITIVVLVLILKHFFFEKVHRFMEARSEQVASELEEAKKTNELAEQRLADYEAQIAGAEDEKRKIIKNAMEDAKVQAGEVLSQANEEAQKLREKNLREIERDKKAARKELQKEVGDLAVLAAGKILEQELDSKKQEAVVNKIIEEAEDSAWEE